jgi:23S rRNA pseudouridine2605 synthase
MLTRLRSNVDLEDGPAHFDRLVAEGAGEGSNQWYKVSVKEGRNRLGRRLWESQDVKVSRLIRTRYGPVALPRWLSRGKLHEMPAADVAELAKAAGLPPTPADKLRVVPVPPRHKRRSQKRRRLTGKS